MGLDIRLVDFPFVCRICLTRGELRLFHELDCLWDLFLAITKIDVSSAVDFPRNICNECINKLEDISQFINVAQYNDPCSGKKLVSKTGSIEYPETVGSETYQEAFEFKGDISLQIFQFCRICSSPRSLILCEENSSLMELFRTITNTDVKTDINSSSRSSLCNKCVNELEKISSFMDLLFYNNRKLQNAISRNEAIKTESYPDGKASDVGSTRCEEIKVDLNEIKVEKSFDENSRPHESNYMSTMIDIKEEKFDSELVTSIEQHYQNSSELGPQNQFSKTIFDLQQHSLIHTEETTFKCDCCEKQFTQKNNLKQHMLIHTREKLLKCDRCEKSFTLMGSLKRHMLTHTGERPFKCDSCETSFSQKSGLKRHLLTHTGRKPFKCNSCEKCFSEKSNLKKHILLHTEERPFKCDRCEKQYTRPDYLNQHMLSHTGEKPFECDCCKKQFGLLCILKRHMLTHMGEKRFKCDLCEKSFNQKGALKQHMLIHTGEKLFKCDCCEIRFTHKLSLQRHILTHTGESPFELKAAKKVSL